MLIKTVRWLGINRNKIMEPQRRNTLRVLPLQKLTLKDGVLQVGEQDDIFKVHFDFEHLKKVLSAMMTEIKFQADKIQIIDMQVEKQIKGLSDK
jgi:hypothetical protein